MIYLTAILIAIFLSGLYFYMTGSFMEGYENSAQNSNKATPTCPNILIQKGSKFYLSNSKLAKVPGVNPIEFDNLEDYVEFTEWQRSKGVICPVLYLQKTYDAQGESVYKIRPGVDDVQGGLPPSLANQPKISAEIPALTPTQNPTLPLDQKQSQSTGQLKKPNPTLLVDATRNDQPYNTNSIPSYDTTSYYVGTTTPLDKMNEDQEHLLHSPDPMDPNWGGGDYTQSLVDKGYYAGNEVMLRV